MPMRVAFCVLAIAVSVVAQADSRVLATGSALEIRIEGEHPIVGSSLGPALQGTVEVSPAPVKPRCDRLVFYVDGEAKAPTEADGSTLVLDTTTLKDGEHSLQLVAERGGRLVLSTGAVSVRVANAEGSAVADEVAEGGDKASPPFSKVYRAVLTHEAIWFRGEEGDLERHAYQTSDRMYLTLTDLVRHIGGGIVWGPKASHIEVHRSDITLRVFPGSKTVRVNNNAVELPLPTVVKDGRTYVPARAVCEILGVYIEWNKDEKRAYVYAPQPSYGVELRQYPWIATAAGFRNYLGNAPAQVAFHNYSGLPVHVLLQGNGFRADWQIHGHSTLSPVFVAAGTYKITVWSRQGEDFEDYITLASGVTDTYDITVGANAHTATLHSH